MLIEAAAAAASASSATAATRRGLMSVALGPGAIRIAPSDGDRARLTEMVLHISCAKR